MLKKFLGCVALASLAVAPTSAQDAKTAISDASKAMGVEKLKSVQYSATGFDFVLGQAVNPASPWPKFIEKSYTRAIDFEVPASRVDRVRMQGENPPRGGGQQPLVGEQTQNQTIIVNAGTPWVQQLEIWMTPHGFLRVAATKNATLSQAADEIGRKHRVIRFIGENKAPVLGFLNEENLVERVQTTIDNPFLGDMPFETRFNDYQDVDGVKFPMHIVQTQGDYPIFDLKISDVKVNAAVNIQPPQGRGGVPPPAAAAGNPQAQSEKLGDGVYLITGGYSVIAVDFKDYIALVECGQNEPRALAVIAEAKRLIPNKPIRYLINTHSHIDHSSGLRAFVAEGTTIITHQVNKAYLEKVLSLPHTLNPDKAQTADKKPKVEAMGEKRILTDGTHVIELHHLQNFGHHDGMIVAYFPKEKVLLEADAYNPQAMSAAPITPPSPFTLSLVDNIQRLKLDVQRIVPVHYPADSRVVTMAELLKWVGRS
jgi:glyoxylase-like metal-dependent hydrolase (beta-lactamase superfamily II)